MRYLLMILLLAGCSSKVSVEKRMDKFCRSVWDNERLTLVGYKETQEFGYNAFTALFVSYKHIGIDEARRMIMALKIKLEAAVEQDYQFVIGIEYKEMGSPFMPADYMGKVVLKKDKIRFYVCDQAPDKFKLIFEEEVEHAFGHAFGYPAKEGFAPFSH